MENKVSRSATARRRRWADRTSDTLIERYEISMAHAVSSNQLTFTLSLHISLARVLRDIDARPLAVIRVTESRHGTSLEEESLHNIIRVDAKHRVCRFPLGRSNLGIAVPRWDPPILDGEFRIRLIRRAKRGIGAIHDTVVRNLSTAVNQAIIRRSRRGRINDAVDGIVFARSVQDTISALLPHMRRASDSFEVDPAV